MGAVAGPAILQSAINVCDKSTDEACIVHVPGTGWFGSGHCVVIAGFTFAFQASGIKPKNSMSFVPSAVPQSSVGRPPSGQGIASAGLASLSTENIGRKT